MRLGAGREKAGDEIDHSVGVVLCRKRGDRVAAGESLAILHANDSYRLSAARDLLLSSYNIGFQPPTPKPLILGVVTRDGEQRWV